MEPKKRPRRIPLTAEEVANVIAHKKRREILILQKFKSSRQYKILNLFTIICFFIYCELLFCFYGPCHFDAHFSKNMVVKHGNGPTKNGEMIIASIEITGMNNKEYTLVVDDHIITPAKQSNFFIGKDFLLQKELKGSVETSSHCFRLFSASPVLFLSVFFAIISCIAFIFNLNESAYTLTALSVLNALTLIGILLY